jgi:predicted dehydrogenase
MTQIRYVLAGTGSRGLWLYGQGLGKGAFQEHSKLVGLFDISPGRLEEAKKILGVELPLYTDFDRMLTELDPDGVIIATNDASHAEYVIRVLQAGKQVICEKPLAINAAQIRSVLSASRNASSAPRISLVTHNMRYSPAIAHIKKLIIDGAIGSLLNITYCDYLDRRHGADYFRRWHRFRENSGGLLIQKACHDFDILNWFVGSLPYKVIARGGLAVYGKCGPFRGARCKGCAHAKSCDYYADLWSGSDYALYSQGEEDSGYIRDGCVYDERIDIEDHADVLYEYDNGVKVNYHFLAFASIEGLRMEIEGTQGRIIYESTSSTESNPGKMVIHGLESHHAQRMTLYSYSEGICDIPGDQWMSLNHWESDNLYFLKEYFGRPIGAPLTPRQATLEESAWAVLIGATANLSISENSKPIEVKKLLADE